MYRAMKFPLLLGFLLCAGVDCRNLREMTSYGNEYTFYGKRIYLGTGQIVTDSESYVYAVCDAQDTTFPENQCSVVVETPSFADAVYKDTCNVNLTSGQKYYLITDLKLHPFGDDRVLLSWRAQKVLNGSLGHTFNVRILEMSNCKYYEVALDADVEYGLLLAYPRESAFDVILSGNGTCDARTCRITYDVTGRRVARPRRFLPDGVGSARILEVVPVAAGSPAKGFYALIRPSANKLDEVQVLQVDADHGNEAGAAAGSYSFASSNFATSNAYERFTVCWACDRTNVTCRQYDGRMRPQLHAVLGFADEPGFGAARWLRIHNSREGGFLLATGPRAPAGPGRGAVTLARVQPDGRRDRPLEVRERGFECASTSSLLVDVSENDEEEVCVHAACNGVDYGHDGSKSTLKYGTRCLYRLYVSPAKRKPSVLN